jgi:hypothetical protein
MGRGAIDRRSGVDRASAELFRRPFCGAARPDGDRTMDQRRAKSYCG